MKGVDSCEYCGNKLPFEGDMGDRIKKGETVIRVETHPDTNNNMIKSTQLYHPDCYVEKLKEELRTDELEEEVKQELREELREEMKEEVEKEIEEEDSKQEGGLDNL